MNVFAAPPEVPAHENLRLLLTFDLNMMGTISK